MPPTDANIAKYYFNTDTLAQDTLQVVDMVGQEAISQLFRFDLNLISEDPEINAEDLVNKQATLTVDNSGQSIRIHGIVSDFQQGGMTSERVAYRVTMVPRLWLLSLTYQSRVFQNMKTAEIIEQVLKDGGLTSDDFRISLHGTYPAREYVVQYRETDLNFVSRWMEFEGMYYYFDHEGDHDLLVITDEKSDNVFIEGEAEVKYHPGTGMGVVEDESEEVVLEMLSRERIVTGKVVLKDYNYRTPETALRSESAINRGMPGMYYEYGQHFKDTAEGNRLAKTRNEEIEAGRRIFMGESTCVRFRCGHKFTLAEHYRSSFDGDYLITHVSHSGSQGAAFSGPMGGGNVPTYHNEFTCIPADVQFRAARITPEPRIPGIMTARVETAGGDYAHVDEEGRYRVKMPFDMSDRGNATATRPLRLAQPYAGSGYGMHFPVHAGTEMVWACVDGNIDRPLGLSTVPNPSRQSPVVSTNNSQNVIRTHGGNLLLLDDKIDEAQIIMSSTDQHKVLLDDKEDKIEVTSTKKNIFTMDDKNENVTIKTTNGHQLLMDDKNTKVTVVTKNGHFMTFNDKDGEEKITIADKDNKNTIIIDISNKKIVIKTDEGNIDMHAPKGLIDIKAKELKIETEADTSLKAMNITTEAKQDHKGKAANMKLEATMDFSIKGMTVKSEASTDNQVKGLNVTTEASVNNQVKGSLVTVQATGPNTIKGLPVQIN